MNDNTEIEAKLNKEAQKFLRDNLGIPASLLGNLGA